MRARKRLVFFGPKRQLCMQLGFTQSSETECNGPVMHKSYIDYHKYLRTRLGPCTRSLYNILLGDSLMVSRLVVIQL